MFWRGAFSLSITAIFCGGLLSLMNWDLGFFRIGFDIALISIIAVPLLKKLDDYFKVNRGEMLTGSEQDEV